MAFTRSEAFEAVRRDVEEMKAIAGDIRARSASLREERDQANQRVERERREGELGREWQILQQRIDLHQTTFNDILTGMDRSREARAVRAMIIEGLPTVKKAFDEVVRKDEDGSYARLQTALNGLEADKRAWGV
jgi:uncharacterized protein YukE